MLKLENCIKKDKAKIRNNYSKSGTSCKIAIWPSSLNHTFGLNAMISKQRMQGTVPVCVYSLDKLELLHLSANGFSGSLPSSSSSYSSQLVDFSISHNFITGTIPPFLLTKGMTSLDLSFNKLRGYIDEVVYNNNTSILSTQHVVNKHNMLSTIPTQHVVNNNRNNNKGQ